ncbi:MAG: rod shape-determining protein MreB, rod shape-determining protein MreB [Microgenomates group bacterium GW2011_GWC1_43_11]|uniref:Cell shape-determining protein MreB n=2 Tax=Candidatus Gottesmaniibacteriota TaxID=1752720 RepID=A0A0G1LMX0_9BACT|nr:MAG: rod shape-determining protein MreB, rod shape-determining protein MreB [Microgenomates group bacterium GW2011_GWC1_43_11]KKT38831.1 MAG: Cell shape determining protein, MreB/Mrl family [Candidatus Gottesmanbacteria bacterium GW2011_GWB1_44_11c]KKT61204.1 MAG: Cell shape determining protein, MreB/Mrl family [Candidatus Gottesmanbacteria bacterium GW2011_GWA1_44_24b]HCM82018.1 rod shape-determining protein [Patescibacteria group bacterium]
MFGLTKRIGIDLGTANSLVWLAGTGVVLNEPTVVAVTVDDNRVVAVGNEAKDMLGRTPGNITATRPMRDGVIADYRITEAMLSYFIDRAVGKNRFFKPEVMICVPTGVTQVERRAVMDATLSAGAKVVYIIEEPLASSIGAKIPIAQASGNMIVDVGGGSTEAAVISLGGVVVHRSARVAGNKIEEAIAQYIKRQYNLIIGERMAETIKITIGDALGDEKLDDRALKVGVEDRGSKIEEKNLPSSFQPQPPFSTIDHFPSSSMEVRGRDAISGLPRMITLTRKEVTGAIAPVLQQIITAVKQVLENTPPELAADIIDKGIVMAGGTSLLTNFDKLMTKETGVVCHVAEEPLLCVVRGTGVAIENIELYKRSVSRK